MELKGMTVEDARRVHLALVRLRQDPEADLVMTHFGRFVSERAMVRGATYGLMAGTVLSGAVFLLAGWLL